MLEKDGKIICDGSGIDEALTYTPEEEKAMYEAEAKFFKQKREDIGRQLVEGIAARAKAGLPYIPKTSYYPHTGEREEGEGYTRYNAWLDMRVLWFETWEEADNPEKVREKLISDREELRRYA